MADVRRIAEEYVDEARWDEQVLSNSISDTTTAVPRPPPQQPHEFEPTVLFLYGTLQIPRVLKSVLKLEEDPIYECAFVDDFKIRLWGPYPALVPDGADDARESVKGLAYTVTTPAHFQRLVQYEGESYLLKDVDINVTRNEEDTVVPGMTFVYIVYPEELVDGEFDAALFNANSNNDNS